MEQFNRNINFKVHPSKAFPPTYFQLSSYRDVAEREAEERKINDLAHSYDL